MLQLLQTAWETFQTIINCYIIWIIGPDGTLFDILSILKIIGSGFALITPLYRLAKIFMKWYEWQ